MSRHGDDAWNCAADAPDASDIDGEPRDTIETPPIVHGAVRCDDCDGTGSCPTCGDNGSDCATCENSGECPECDGTGSYEPFDDGTEVPS